MPTTLASLCPGKAGTLLSISNEALRLRLEPLGLTPGTTLQRLSAAPAGDPIAFRVRGVTLSLRLEDAGQIFLQPGESRPASGPLQASPSPRQSTVFERVELSDEGRTLPCAHCSRRADPPVLKAGKNPVMALVGNPNCGKTSLFNALTGARQAVGNWPGVTVEALWGRVRTEGGTLMLADLPGVYSLSRARAEEKAAREFLQTGQAGVILNVVDASHLERNLYLTLECRALGLPMVVALTFTDRLARQRLTLDTDRLQTALGVPVIPVDSARGTGLDALLAAARAQARAGPGFGTGFAFPARAEARYAVIDALVRDCLPQAPGPDRTTAALDRLLTGKYTALPCFFAVMAGVFFLTFGPAGNFLALAMDQALCPVMDRLVELLARLPGPGWLEPLVMQGIGPGVGGVVRFLPQVALLFFCLSALEASGYLARAAFLLDRPMRALGLEGKAAISLLLGFGCTVTAALSARTLDSPSGRRRLLLVLPFVSCSAKLPVYLLLCRLWLPGRAWLGALGLYGLGLAGGLVTCLLLPVSSCQGDFLLELPPYQLPRLSGLLAQTWQRVRAFLLRAGTLIVLLSTLVWVLGQVGPGFAPAISPEDSLLGRLGAALVPVLEPLGLGSPAVGISLLTGLAAKEAVASSLTQLGGLEGLGPASALALCVVLLYYPPCVSAQAALGRELQRPGLLVLSLLWQMLWAWTAGFWAFRLGLQLL